MSNTVLVVGDYCLDVIFTGLPSMPTLGEEIFGEDVNVTIGGGTFPTSMVLRRLGITAEACMQFGNDFFSSYAMQLLRAAGLDSRFFRVEDQPLRRLTVALSYPEDRAFVSIADPPLVFEGRSRFGAASLDEQSFDHIHIAHLSAGLAAADLIRRAKRDGISISLDCGWNLKAIHDAAVWETLGQVDVFLPNEKEVLEITGEKDLELGFQKLAENIPLSVVKLGREGSIGITQDDRVAVPSIPVESVDTTAAGDCFNAGFIFGYLQNHSLENCLLAGNICGALSVTALGWQNAPDQEQLVSLIRRVQNGW